MSESADICDLFNDGHFLFKVADAAAAFYGTKNLLEFEAFRDTFHATVVSLAFPGSLIAMCILIYLYKIKKKDDIIEDIFLMVYGVMNFLAVYYCYLRRKHYMGCPVSMFNNVNCMMVAGSVAATCMLGEKLYYLVCGEGGGRDDSEGGGGGGREERSEAPPPPPKEEA